MKLRRIFAAIAACAVAATMAISASADFDQTAKISTDGNNSVELVGENGAYASFDEMPEFKAVRYTFEIDENLAKLAVDGTEWVAGGMGTNDNWKKWSAVEWSFQDGVKPITAQKVSDGVYTLVLTADELGRDFFDKDASEFLQIWCQLYNAEKTSIPANFKVTKAEFLSEVPAAPEKPADSTTEKPADSTKPAESTADSTKPADDSNKPTGATAGLALAGLAIAGAAVVAAKKSK